MPTRPHFKQRSSLLRHADPPQRTAAMPGVDERAMKDAYLDSARYSGWNLFRQESAVRAQSRRKA